MRQGILSNFLHRWNKTWKCIDSSTGDRNKFTRQIFIDPDPDTKLSYNNNNNSKNHSFRTSITAVILILSNQN